MRKVLVAAIAAASAVTLASGLTVTAAQASRTRSASSSGTDSSGTETFRIISVNASLHRESTLAYGHFTNGGYTVTGKLNPTTLDATARMVYPNGAFSVYEHVTSQYLPLPTPQCEVFETIKGSYTLGAGTGSYKRISGSGSFETKMTAVVSRVKGECGGSMIVYQEITSAGGRVST
jgi:hypothetical protein